MHYLKDWSATTGHREASDWRSEAESEGGDLGIDSQAWTTSGFLANTRERSLRSSDRIPGTVVEFEDEEPSIDQPSSNLPLTPPAHPAHPVVGVVVGGVVGVGGAAEHDPPEPPEAARTAHPAPPNTNTNPNNDIEATERRRRNRVTMVLHEGDGYIDESDIYRPEGGGG